MKQETINFIEEKADEINRLRQTQWVVRKYHDLISKVVIDATYQRQCSELADEVNDKIAAECGNDLELLSKYQSHFINSLRA